MQVRMCVCVGVCMLYTYAYAEVYQIQWNGINICQQGKVSSLLSRGWFLWFHSIFDCQHLHYFSTKKHIVYKSLGQIEGEILFRVYFYDLR